MNNAVRKGETSNEPGIFVLNEYCWCAVLDYLPIEDIIRSERVSRQWQSSVLTYLRCASTRICVNLRCERELIFFESTLDPLVGYRQVTFWVIKGLIKSFKKWTTKLGTWVKAVTSCGYPYSSDGLKIIRQNCTNLEDLILEKTYQNLAFNKSEKNCFKLLKTFTLLTCNFTDHCVTQLIKNSIALEKLEISSSNQLTGQCLCDIKTKNLKSLVIKGCQSIQFQYLFSAENILNGLTKLELNDISSITNNEVYDNIHLLVDKTCNLEYLIIYGIVSSELDNGFGFKRRRDSKFIESVCRLSKLECLATNYGFTDEDVEAVLGSCTKIRSFELDRSLRMTRLSMATVCRYAGARLTDLRFKWCWSLKDNDVLDCIHKCPNLTSLDVSNCRSLTVELPAQVMRMRRKIRAPGVLLMRVAGTDMTDCELENDTKYTANTGLILVYSAFEHRSWRW